MRLTYHSSQRQAGKTARHNDRNFDVTKAENIDPSRTDQNLNVTCYGKDMSFDEAELKFYSSHFGAYQDDMKSRAEKARHPERAKTMDQILHGTKTRPTEDIVQIGSKDECPSPEVLKAVTADFIRWHEKAFPQCKILDVSWHLDEATPHAHIRRAWIGHDKNGVAYPCMEKALTEMGIERPFPEKAESRHNCRAISYTKACREELLTLCREHSLQLEEAPKERSEVGLTLTEYKARQEDQKARAAEARAAEARQEADTALSQLQEASRRLEAAKAEADKARAERDTLAAAARDREEKIAVLEKEIADLKRDRGIIGVSRPAKTAVQESRLHPGMVLISESDLRDLQGRAGIGDSIRKRGAKLTKRKEDLQERENAVQSRERQVDMAEKQVMVREKAARTGTFMDWIRDRHPEVVEEYSREHPAQTHHITI